MMTIAEIVEAFKLNDEQKHYDAAWSCVKILNDERIDDIIKVWRSHCQNEIKLSVIIYILI